MPDLLRRFEGLAHVLGVAVLLVDLRELHEDAGAAFGQPAAGHPQVSHAAFAAVGVGVVHQRQPELLDVLVSEVLGRLAVGPSAAMNSPSCQLGV